jgi:hypothetical protein
VCVCVCVCVCVSFTSLSVDEPLSAHTSCSLCSRSTTLAETLATSQPRTCRPAAHTEKCVRVQDTMAQAGVGRVWGESEIAACTMQAVPAHTAMTACMYCTLRCTVWAGLLQFGSCTSQHNMCALFYTTSGVGVEAPQRAWHDADGE